MGGEALHWVDFLGVEFSGVLALSVFAVDIVYSQMTSTLTSEEPQSHRSPFYDNPFMTYEYSSSLF